MTATKSFKAAVQYDDLVGTVAADREHHYSLDTILEEKGLISRAERDVVVAIEFWSGENHGGPAHECDVTLTVANLKNYNDVNAYFDDPGRPPLRSISITMTNDEFLGHFKRFKIVLMSQELKDLLTDHAFEVEEMKGD
jgi:hypothetical protein